MRKQKTLAYLIECLGLGLGLAACVHSPKNNPPKLTYRSSYLASTDGHSFHSLVELFDEAEKAKPFCRSIKAEVQTKAQYLVERNDSDIKLTVKECESTDPSNCANLKKCLELRPVAWLSRAAGRLPTSAGLISSDWIGRCGGQVAVSFYYGPQAHLPLERVGCSEPVHDKIDTAYDMYMIARPDDNTPAAPPFIEVLLKKWDAIAFGFEPGNASASH